MKKLRRVIASLSMVAILSMLVVSSTASAGQYFEDVPDNEWYASYVNDLAALDIIDGTQDYYRPGDNVNRAESVKLLVEAFLLEGGSDISFPDVSEVDWYYEHLRTAFANGLIVGYTDGTFRGGYPINRAELVKIVVIAADLPECDMDNPFPDVPAGEWYEPFATTAYCWSVIDGYSDGTFGGVNNTTRAEAAKIISNAMNPMPRPDGVEPPVTGGDLTVTLNPDSPKNQTVPAGATGATMAIFDFTAGDQDVWLESITLEKGGIGDADDFAKVYLYDGGAKLTPSGRTFNTDNEANFYNLDTLIPATDTLSVATVVDVDPNTGSGLHTFIVSEVDATEANVTGLPVESYTNATSDAVTVGLCDVESNGADYTRKVGEKGVEVANFSVHVSNDEDAWLESITLYNDGRDILDNLELYRGNDQIATCTEADDYFVCPLDEDYPIPRGESVSFKGKGDTSGRDGDDATLYVRYNTDVRVRGETYGYYLGLDGTEGDDGTASYVDEQVTGPVTTLSSNTTTVEAGQLTVSFNGPPTADVSLNSNNVPLLYFSLTPQAEMDVEKMTVDIDLSGGVLADSLEDLEVVCDGNIVGSTNTVSASNEFTDFWTLDTPGLPVECEVRIDVTNGATPGETVTATLVDLSEAAGNWKFVSDGDDVTDIVPSGDIEGHAMTITEASLTVDVASNPAAESYYVKNAQDVETVGFAFTAGDSADVKVTSLSLLAYYDADDNGFGDVPGDFDDTSGAEDAIVQVTIYDADYPDTPLASPKALTVNDTANTIGVDFDTLDWNITASDTDLLLVETNLSSTIDLGGGPPTKARFAMDISDVTAEYGSGTNLTGITINDNSTPDIYQYVMESGSLDMTIDPDTPDASMLLMGASDIVTIVQFSATDEDFVIQELNIINNGSNSSDIKSVTLDYLNSEGAAESKTKVFIGFESQFTGLDIFTPKDDDAILDIISNTQTSIGGAVNGGDIQLEADNTALTVKYIGQQSGETGTSFTAAAVGEPMWVFEAYPVFEFDGSTPDGDLIPSANTLIGILNVTAEGSEDVTFEDDGTANELTVQLAASGALNQDADIWMTDGVDTLCSGAVNLSTTSFWTCDFADNDLIVGSGGESIYTYLDTTAGANGAGLTTEGDSIQVWLSDATPADLDFSVDYDDGAYEFADLAFRGGIYGGALVKP